MRELTLDEVELVHGGYQAGTDGPSGFSWGGLAVAGGAGAALGTTAGVGIGLATGYTGLALAALGAQGAAWGTVYGTIAFFAYNGATALGADRVGSAIGRELYFIRHGERF